MSSDIKFKAVATSLLIALSKSAFAGTLITNINGIEEAGVMHLAIYDTASAFENDSGDKSGPSEDMINGIIEWVDTESVTYRFEIPAGNYAIGIFIDTNANEALDRISYRYQQNSMASVTMPKVDLGHPPLLMLPSI